MCAFIKVGSEDTSGSTAGILQGRGKDGCFIVSLDGLVGKAAAIIQKMDPQLGATQSSCASSQESAWTKKAHCPAPGGRHCSFLRPGLKKSVR